MTKQEKTKQYIVIREGVCLKGTKAEKMHARVNLTDAKALAMIGKVRLLEEYEADNRSDNDLKAELAKLTKKVESLTAERDELANAVEQLSKAPPKKTK